MEIDLAGTRFTVAFNVPARARTRRVSLHVPKPAVGL